jgi:WD40 repeat protein
LRQRGLSLSGSLFAALLVQEPALAALAALPATLSRSTLRAAIAGPTSARVADLVQGRLKALAGTPRIKWALLAMASLVTGATLLACRGQGEPAAHQAEPPQPQQRHKQGRADHFGDPLPPGALARLGTVRWRPGLPIAQIAFSPDGKTLATDSMNMEADDNLVSLCLWDRATGRRLRQFAARKRSSLALDFAPDGKSLATQDLDGTVRLWDLEGKELRRITRGGVSFTRQLGPGSSLRGVGFAFSPNGKALAARGPDKAIHLWETATGKEVRKLTTDPEDSSPLVFSHDGKLLATSVDKLIRLWDVETGKEQLRLQGHEGLAGIPAFSADGKTFTAIGRTPGQLYQVTAYVWNVAGARPGGKLLRKWDLPPNPVFACCLSPDGKTVLAGGYAGGMRLYDLATGKEIYRLTASFRGTLFAVAFSPDGKTIAGGGENRVLQQWDAKTGKPLPGYGHQGIIESLSLSSDGKYLASVAADEGIRLWDMKSARPLPQFRSPPGEFAAVAFVPGGKTLAAVGRDAFVRLLEVPTGKEVRRFAGPPDGRVVALSADGTHLAAGARDGGIWVWETATGKLLHQLQHPRPDQSSGGVLCLAFSPDNGPGRLLASGGWGKGACLWSVATGRRWAELPGHDYWVYSLCFSPDGKTLAVAHRDRTIRLWEVLSGKERGRLSGHAHRVTGLAFAPDGRLASSSHDGTVRVWDIGPARGREIRRFTGHESVVGPLAFSADGKTLVSGGWDTTILLWDVQGLPRGRVKGK